MTPVANDNGGASGARLDPPTIDLTAIEVDMSVQGRFEARASKLIALAGAREFLVFAQKVLDERARRRVTPL